MISRFLFVILISLSLSGCQKYKFPKITEEGKNTFGWIFDGQKRMSRAVVGELISPYKFSQEVYKGRPYFVLSGTDKDYEKNGHDFLTVQGDSVLFTGVGTYNIGEYDKPGQVGAFYRSSNLVTGREEEYKTLASNSGILTVSKYDVKNKIVSGTFYFTAFKKDGSKAEISDGRFDLKLN